MCAKIERATTLKSYTFARSDDIPSKTRQPELQNPEAHPQTIRKNLHLL